MQLLTSNDPYWIEQRRLAKEMLAKPEIKRMIEEFIEEESDPLSRINAYDNCLHLQRDPFK